MSSLLVAARSLLDLAAELEAEHKLLFTTFNESVDLADAAVRLRQAMGPKTFLTIDMELHIPDGTAPSMVWRIWDGKKHHEGKTLALAVNACLIYHSPGADDPLQSAQAALVGESPPF